MTNATCRPSGSRFGLIPAELRERPQWVLWRTEERDGKPTKVPYRADGNGRASSTDAATWSTFDGALAASSSADGIGFVFSKDDPYVGVDLDDWNPDAAAIVNALGSYTETSVSGRGAHVILRGSLNGHPRNRKGPIELYGEGRYFVITGDHMRGTPTTIEHRQKALEEVLEHVFGAPETHAVAPPAVAPAHDDDELLKRARSADHGAKFERLWSGDADGYSSASEADLALCNFLAFWAGPDPGRVDGLFRRSGLMRAKWDERRGETSYGAQTIARALEGRTEFFDWSKHHSPAPLPRETAPSAEALDEPFALDVLTTRALCELPGPPGSDELLGPLVIRGQRIVLGGHTGEGKTTAALHIVRAVTAGSDFLDWTGSGGRALFLDAEQGLRTIQRRLGEAELDTSELVDYIRVPDGLSLDSDPRHVAEVERVLSEGDYALVVIDPLYKLHTGDSNAEREAVDLMKRLDGWREAFGFALLLPVHCRKPLPGTKFSIHDLFGSSAYVRGAEVVLGLQRVSDGYARLHFLKDRDGDLPIHTAWGLLFDREQGFRRDPNEGRKPTALDQVRDLLADDPELSTAQLVEITGYAERTIRKAVKELSGETEEA